MRQPWQNRDDEDHQGDRQRESSWAERPRFHPEPQPRPSPGKVSLTSRITHGSGGVSLSASLPPPDPVVQPTQPRLAGSASEVAANGEEGHAIAATGLDGAGGVLPHIAAIQASFGRHDVGHVRAAVGGPAADATAALGAEAYASGDRVAFAREPDLHTAAHEAAHVVQQRAGVSLAGGFGREGDAYERHADRVADAVVRGESAEALLDEMAPAGAGDGAVQRKATAGAVQLENIVSDEARQSRGLVYRLLHDVRNSGDTAGARRLATVFEAAASRDGHLVFDYGGNHYDLRPPVDVVRRAAGDFNEMAGGSAVCGVPDAPGSTDTGGGTSGRGDAAQDAGHDDGTGAEQAPGQLADLASVDENLERDVRVTGHVDATIEYLAPAIRALLPEHDRDLPDDVGTALRDYRNAANRLASATRSAVNRLLRRGGTVDSSEVEEATAEQRAALDGPRAALRAALIGWLRECGREGRNPNARAERNQARTELRRAARRVPRPTARTLARLAFTQAALERVEHGVGSDADPPTPRVRRLEELGNQVLHRVLPREWREIRGSVEPAAEGSARQAQIRELRSRRDSLRQQLGEQDEGTLERLDTWENRAREVDEGGDVGNAPPDPEAARRGLALVEGGSWTQQYEADAWSARAGGRNLNLRPKGRASHSHPGGFFEGGGVDLTDEAVEEAARETGENVGDPEQARRAEEIIRIIDAHEGHVDAVNTYDDQTLTLPMGLSRAGRFQRVLANLARDEEDPGAFERLFGRYGVSIRVNESQPGHSDVRVRVRSPTAEAPLPTHEDGRPYTPGEVLRGEAAYAYWGRDPMLCMISRAAASDPAYQRATAGEVARSAETSLETTVSAGEELGPQPLREVLADADEPLVDACFASLADLWHGLPSSYRAAVRELNDRFAEMVHARVEAGEDPVLPLPASQQNELARVPVQRTLDRPGSRGGSARGGIYEEHIEGLNLEASGVRVRQPRRRRSR